MAKLEALRISNEGVIRNLQSELAALQDKLRLLQEERDGLENSRLNITESQGARIKALEKVSTLQLIVKAPQQASSTLYCMVMQCLLSQWSWWYQMTPHDSKFISYV